ncbi:MAG TPA: GNAT family N-acetyltransferase [Bryobacteraceae bacterium]|nr:GNAT family N-acetyltransferase [Bryobacteraceae bacterium]
MTSLSQVQIECWRPDPQAATQDIQMLGSVLHACVHAGASVNFVLPFSHDDAKAFWSRKVLPAVQSGICRVLVARGEGRILGTVQLDLATPPNQPHRAEVRKLLVHPSARRRGIARALMLAVEQQAREARRNLLTLDTVTGGFAEPLYLSLGYVKVGVIPLYAVRPDSSEWDATTIMYKDLGPLA